MYKIERESYDEFSQTAEATLDGERVKVKNTWAWPPLMTWYDITNEKWIDEKEWQWI